MSASLSPLWEKFFRCAEQIGCTAAQVRNFINAGTILLPKQLQASAAARLCDQPDGPTAIGYGGARGGGKSHWLLAQIGADDCQRLPGLKALLLRKSAKSNKENFEDLRRRTLSKLNYHYASNRGLLQFENGSQIVIGHFQHEKDIDAYLGLSYDVIGIEEATTLTHRKRIDIRTCLRTAKPNWRPREYSTTNPGGIGHAWYKKEFIVPYRKHQETTTRFIPALVDDNLFLNREYKAGLLNLPGWQKGAWCHGNWDIDAGQYFSNWNPDVHVVKEFDPRRGTEWFAAMEQSRRYGSDLWVMIWSNWCPVLNCIATKPSRFYPACVSFHECIDRWFYSP